MTERIIAISGKTTMLFLLTIVARSTSIPDAFFDRIETSRGCDVNNPQFWNLINWFFQRTTNVAVTAIMDNTLTRSDTSTTFIRSFSMSKNAFKFLQKSNNASLFRRQFSYISFTNAIRL